MAAAIRLARRHEGLTGTNPSVACVLVRDDGHGSFIVGSGVTAIGGRPHAEPLALEDAGHLAQGATAYVTLEPCAHHGSTPPCAQTLINAGVARVVTAVVDPDSRVNSKGHAMLREAGITVDAGVCESEAREGLAAYLNHKSRKRPQVILKLALSADGYLGVEGQGQVAITGAVANAQSHLLRARNHAILIGRGTLESDNPSLSCRLPGLENRSPNRIVLSGRKLPDPQATIFQTAQQQRTILATADMKSGDAGTFEKLGVEIIKCDLHEGRIALPELLDDLAAIGIMSVLVEGGAELAQSFLDADLVDELYLYRGSFPVASKDHGMVRAPIDENAADEKFRRVEKLVLGDDLLYRYIRR